MSVPVQTRIRVDEMVDSHQFSSTFMEQTNVAFFLALMEGWTCLKSMGADSW